MVGSGRARALRHLAIASAASAVALAALALPPPSIRVIRAVFEDDGDNDGYADTRETVQMRIEVRNLTGTALTGVVALLATDDPKIAAIPDNNHALGVAASDGFRCQHSDPDWQESAS